MCRKEKSPFTRQSVLWHLCIWCFLLLTQQNSQLLVGAAYSDADDLINELDRPSK